MRISHTQGRLALGLVAAGVVVLAGCGQNAGPANATKPSTASPAVAQAEKPGDKGHAGEGWWCNEHGVPEHDCALCNDKVAADYKAKGDWCKEHDRPESQCFLCSPKRAEKFAAQYRAKFDKEPPAPAPENIKGQAKPGDKAAPGS